MLAAVPSAGLFVSVAPALAPTPMSQRRCLSQSQTGWPPTVREIGGGGGVGGHQTPAPALPLEHRQIPEQSQPTTFGVSVLVCEEGGAGSRRGDMCSLKL